MWHHEDAGISYNAWRTVLAHGVKAALVHLPEKGWIWPWYHKEIAEKQGSSRGIIMHKVTPDLYPMVTAGDAQSGSSRSLCAAQHRRLLPALLAVGVDARL